MTQLTRNAGVSENYVKAFAGGSPISNIDLNALKAKRNLDYEVAKLDATNAKGLFGGYKTTVPDMKKLVYIKPNEYEARKAKAIEDLEKRRTDKIPKQSNNGAQIEKNLLAIPDVDKTYLLAFAGGKSFNTINKQALMNKVKKDRNVRNILEKS